MSGGSDVLSALIARIYDAAVDPSLWPSVLETVGRFIPGCHANILFRDTARESASGLFVVADDPVYRRLYLDRYVELNPVLQALTSLDVGEIYSISDITTLALFRATRFYKEWQKPQGIVDEAAAVLERSSTSCTLIAIPRHHSHGPVDAAARQRMRQIVPHLQRAIAISKAVTFQNTATTLADAFDAFAASIYLVDAGGRIVHANRSGTELLAQNDILSRSGDRLHAGDPDVDRTLRKVFALAGTGDGTAIGSKGAAIPMTSRSGERYLAHALPLTACSRCQTRPDHTAAIALFVHKADFDRPSVAHAVTERFQLTPTELRVLFGIIDVGRVPDVAPVLGITEQTVKTHLKRLFAKTGTGRQAELVKLVAEFANPMVG